jgi:2,3-bisphosphoglycerate-dependent phosphoglycerate mutase
MKTYIYMVRHGNSPKTGEERTRGLTEKGKLDAEQVTDILEKEGIDVIVSSPYTRSILTVQESANRIGQEVLVFEDLKERMFSAGDKRISDKELSTLLERSFEDRSFSLEGGESNADCQNRAIKVLKELLRPIKDKK